MESENFEKQAINKVMFALKNNSSFLTLAGMKLKSVPSEIGQLINLRKLVLSGNKLSTLPHEIGRLANLENIWINNNQLKSLPPEIGNLKKLKSFSANKNQLSNLTPEFGNLFSLEKLALSSNKLSSLPKTFGQLANLKSLVLSNNLINKLPAEVGQLNKLVALNISRNKLSNLPVELGELKNLERLDISNNQLNGLPPEFGKLIKLLSCRITNNQIEILPQEISNLINLRYLGLRNNQLKSLPLEIEKLSNLKFLILTANNLSSLPEEIRGLVNIEIFDLAGNEIIELPPTIGLLSDLKVLDLGGNKLTLLPPEIGKLSNLQSLKLAGNQLTKVSSEIGRLSNLENLELQKNEIHNLPSEIGQLQKTKTLNLRRNNIKELPKELIQLSSLEILDLRENSLNIPPEILQKVNNPFAILNAIFKVRRALNEAKLVLVGQGNVGKTSIIKRLLKNEFDASEEKTRGVDIHEWGMDSTDGAAIKVHVWDFGGQEIMHATHQFFLTKRSLYLLVLDARLGQDENRLEYWLRMIRSFGGDSSIIVIGDKIDQQLLDIDRRGLQTKYPKIKAFVETSCLDGRGIEELKEVIFNEVNNLPHVHDELPESWFKVKEKLEKLDKDFIPYSEYEAICNEGGITDEISQTTLIGFLHDLGSVLNFRDDPRLQETNILNPEWVTNGVYRILNSNELFQKKGVLETKKLGQMLDRKAYPKSRHMFIVDMMRKFELGYPFEGDNGKYLVPDLLPREEPITGDWEDALAFEYHYTVLPSSIISRFIVRMNPYIYQNLVWRSGVVLEYEGNQIMVKADLEDKKIFIDIIGLENTRRDALSAIRSQMDSIHKTIPGLHVEQKVPLPNHPEAEPVDYEFLRRMENEGRESLPVKAGNNIIDVIVQEVLNRIEDKSKRTEVHIHGNVTDTQFIVGDENQQSISE